MKITNKFLLSFIFFGLITILYHSCSRKDTKDNGLKFSGIWTASDGFRIDSLQIINYNSIYSYKPYNDDSSLLKLTIEGNLVDIKDSSFIIRYNENTDQLILKNNFTGEDIFANRLK